MAWGVEVFVRDPDKPGKKRWARMHPTDAIRRMAYPDSPDVARTVEV